MNKQLQYRDKTSDPMIPPSITEFDAHRLSIDLIEPQAELLASRSHPDRDAEVEVYTVVKHGQHDAAWELSLYDLYYDNDLSGIYGANLASMPGFRWLLAPAKYSFSLEESLRELQKVRQEADEARDVDPIPESAYHDAQVLLTTLFNANCPMPEIGWAEDGSLGFEWRPEGGIATIGIYGDSLVIYGAFFDNKRQVEGVCALSDVTMLKGFLIMLF